VKNGVTVQELLKSPKAKENAMERRNHRDYSLNRGDDFRL